MASTTKPRPPQLPLASDPSSQTLSSTSLDPSNSDERPKERLVTTTLNVAFPQPGFQYNAALHVIDSTPPQTHPTIVPPPQTPLSAGLRLRTRSLSEAISGTSASPIPLNEETLEQASGKAGLPVRSSSVRSALSAARQNIGSLSPGSAYSSPGLGPLVDITPLPSPIAVSSPGPWVKVLDLTESNEMITVTDTSGSMSPSSDPCVLSTSSPKKRRLPLNFTSPINGTYGIDSQIRAMNASSHTRNRSNSEYVPESILIPRPRNIVVSGSTVPLSFHPQSPPIEHLHREEYLAVQRGITVPVAKPPTAPKSNRGTDSSDQESPPTSPKVTKEPLPFYYEAYMISHNRMKQWRAIRKLGQGTFSTVMLATSEQADACIPVDLKTVMSEIPIEEEERLQPKTLVAVKICERGPAGGADEKKIEISLKRELEILKSINHPSLVHLKAVNVMDQRALLVLNYCAGGDLFDMAVTKPDLLVPNLIRRIFAELVAAVQYLHSLYIVHRDIKLENILVNLPISKFDNISDWQSHPYPIVTLTDLGLGRWIPKPPESPMLDTKCGSEDYAAPELLMGQEYDGRSTDSWALGVTLYALMEGRLPFDPIPGARRKSPPKHRIARCDWSWVKYANVDGEWDSSKGQALEGGRTAVEGLLARLRNRWSLQKVQDTEWVGGGISVPGGLRRIEDDDFDANLRNFATATTSYVESSITPQLNKVSRHVTQPKSQGASQAMLYATGLEPSDMSKAQVGIASVWYSGNPCNMHLLDLNHKVKEGVEKSGLIGYQFNTVGVSDAISMGTKGMRYSLQSRDLIADSIETVMGGQWYDANISIPGCDKNMPGVIMAMGRVNRPALMVYGGTIKPGCAATQNNADIDIISAFQSYGQFISGEINEEQRFDIIRNACPGGGACGGMYTANTMATAIEVMGMTLPGSSSNPAESRAKQLECFAAGGAIKKLLVEDIRPSDILTREAFENAMIVVNITGGSTNAVLHLIAIAHSVGIDLTIDDFQSVSDRTPFLADLKPSGKYVMADLHDIGGTPALLKYLLKENIITGNGITVTGQTLAQNLASVPDFPSGQTVIRPLDKPIKKTGHIQILRGSLAPGGCVGKITGKEGTRFAGKAKVYDSEDEMVLALERGAFKKGEKTVVVIRYEGPRGGPGMPEMLKPSSAIMGAGLGKDVALITDGRFSGGSHGFLIGHIVPEAQQGGPIALLKDGDDIVIDSESRKLDVLVSQGELDRRRQQWKAPKPKYEKGTLKKYGRLVTDASHGCITDD